MSEKKIILIVDNNENNQAVFKTYLEIQGFSVFFIENGEPVLPAARDLRPDIILLNIMVPSLDVVGILEDLRNNPDVHDIPIIALTVKSMPVKIADALRTGADEVLTKPFDAEDFLKRVHALIKYRKSQNVIELKTVSNIPRQKHDDIRFETQPQKAVMFQKKFELTLMN